MKKCLWHSFVSAFSVGCACGCFAELYMGSRQPISTLLLGEVFVCLTVFQWFIAFVVADR